MNFNWTLVLSISVVLIIGMILMAKVLTSMKKEKYRQKAKVSEKDIPDVVMELFAKENPDFSQENLSATRQALAEYFNIEVYNRTVSWYHTPIQIPSYYADKLWQTFILFTREYNSFCKNKLGFEINYPDNSYGEVTKRASKYSNIIKNGNTYTLGNKQENVLFNLDEKVIKTTRMSVSKRTNNNSSYGRVNQAKSSDSNQTSSSGMLEGYMYGTLLSDNGSYNNNSHQSSETSSPSSSKSDCSGSSSNCSSCGGGGD